MVQFNFFDVFAYKPGVVVHVAVVVMAAFKHLTVTFMRLTLAISTRITSTGITITFVASTFSLIIIVLIIFEEFGDFLIDFLEVIDQMLAQKSLLAINGNFGEFYHEIEGD